MKYIIILALCLIPQLFWAQSNELMARSEFMQAEASYGEADFTDAISHSNLAIEYLGESKPKLQALIIKSHYALEQFEKAEQAMQIYFELADESDGDYMEMVKMISEIKEKSNVEVKDKKLWETAANDNSHSAYKNYLEEMPNGIYAEEAAKRMEKIIHKKLQALKSKAEYEKLVAAYPEVKFPPYVEMAFIPNGAFTMGQSKKGRVVIDSFYMGKYELTIDQYMPLVEATGNSHPRWLHT